MSNYAEFIAGTDPTDGNSQFTVSGALDSGPPVAFVLGLSGHAGRNYTLQRSLTLAPLSWASVVSTGVLSSNQTLQLTDPSPPASRAFYKVLVSLE